MRRITRAIIKDNFETYFMRVLTGSLKDCRTVLDLACGEGKRLATLGKTLDGLDIFFPYLQEVRAANLYRTLTCGDARFLPYKDGAFDAVIMVELIEHLKKADGFLLLAEAERVARRCVVVTTPNGFLPVPERALYGNPYRNHLSGWHTEEFKQLGYEVMGLHGLKKLRGEHGKYKIRPNWLGRILSEITQKFAFTHPEKAYRLLAVKLKNHG